MTSGSIHRIPVISSGASTYNKLSRIMMLFCCTHNSLVQCNHSYMIPEYDALYDLKKHIAGTFRCVWIMAPVDHILMALLTLNSSQNGSSCRFFIFFRKSLHWIYMKLDSKACCSYVWRCVKDKPRRPTFYGHFGPLIGFWQFCQEVSIRFRSVMRYMLKGVTLRDV